MKFPLPFLLTSSEIEMNLKQQKKKIPNYVSKLAYAICAMFTISNLSSSGVKSSKFLNGAL